MKKMIKRLVLAAVFFTGVSAYALQVGLPIERLALPEFEGEHLVCVWDEAAQDWHTAFVTYNHNGSLDFQVPEFGKWYWVGIWNETTGEYAFGKWIGHFPAS
ncbi:MAG TPA: hypothetical protein VIR63_06335 [Pontiella sp.]